MCLLSVLMPPAAYGFVTPPQVSCSATSPRFNVPPATETCAGSQQSFSRLFAGMEIPEPVQPGPVDQFDEFRAVPSNSSSNTDFHVVPDGPPSGCGVEPALGGAVVVGCGAGAVVV